MSELRYTKDGIPIYDGSSELYIPFRRAALNYVETLEWRKRSLAGPRLQAALEGSARTAVQHQVPGWISHDGGATQLLDFLKSRVQAPTLAEAGKTISKFFYQVKRRRGETMNAWIVRHDEALYEARRTLAEAIHEYAPEGSVGESQSVRGLSGRSIPPSRPLSEAPPGSLRGESPRTSVSGFRSAEDNPFDENGRMRDEEDQPDWHGSQRSAHDDNAWHDQWWQGHRWWDWDYNRQWSEPAWRKPEVSSSLKYGVSSRATAEADRFLPDFVVAWMLLQRSNLDGAERATIISSLKNQFTTEKVTEALRLNWPDDDLKRRDQSRGSALMTDELEEAYIQDNDYDDDIPDDFNDDERAEYVHLSKEVESAHQAIQHHRRTLKEAREKQTFMRKSRQFYPARSSSSSRWKGGQDSKCFRCGGAHSTSACPQKEQSGAKTNSANVGQEVHFTFMTTEATALTANSDANELHAMSLHELVQSGKAIIDGGATASVGSADALDQIRLLNQQQGSSRDLNLKFDGCPSFRFGNNGKTQCLSTAQLDVPLAEKTGKMQIHAHDIPQQPVLLSISALRSLGAVIDFQEDSCILKNIDPQRVVQLERAPSGHQLFPLTQDIFQHSRQRQQPFVSLFDSAARDMTFQGKMEHPQRPGRNL